MLNNKGECNSALNLFSRYIYMYLRLVLALVALILVVWSPASAQSGGRVLNIDWLRHLPFHLNFYCTTLCYSAICTMAVCPSVCLSQVDIPLTQQNLSSHEEHAVGTPGTPVVFCWYFSVAKLLVEIPVVVTPTGGQLHVGQETCATFNN